MFKEKTLKMIVQILKKWYHIWDVIQKGQFSETKEEPSSLQPVTGIDAGVLFIQLS